MEKKLTKSTNKMLSGVLAGIAEYLKGTSINYLVNKI